MLNFLHSRVSYEGEKCSAKIKAAGTPRGIVCICVEVDGGHPHVWEQGRSLRLHFWWGKRFWQAASLGIPPPNSPLRFSFMFCLRFHFNQDIHPFQTMTRYIFQRLYLSFAKQRPLFWNPASINMQIFKTNKIKLTLKLWKTEHTMGCVCAVCVSAAVLLPEGLS